jgi:hypothetical protein
MKVKEELCAFLRRISRKFYVLRITMHTKIKKRKENENGTSVEERNKEREREREREVK